MLFYNMNFSIYLPSTRFQTVLKFKYFTKSLIQRHFEIIPFVIVNCYFLQRCTVLEYSLHLHNLFVLALISELEVELTLAYFHHNWCKNDNNDPNFSILYNQNKLEKQLIIATTINQSEQKTGSLLGNQFFHFQRFSFFMTPVRLLKYNNL